MWPTAADIDDPAFRSNAASLPHKRRASLQSRTSGSARGTPTTFFFRTEDELEQSSSTGRDQSAAVEDSTYGVQSLASNISSVHEDSDDLDHGMQGIGNQQPYENDSSLPDSASRSTSTSTTTPPAAPLYRTVSETSSGSSSSRPLPRDVSNTALSGRLTPLHLYSPIGDNESGPVSTPKSASLRSLQLSEDGSMGDEAASQAVTSGDEDDEANLAAAGESQEAPQLVMPNLRMPTRRPFTARGKDIGKLKILVAGAKGVGKSSLIKSIVQACEDIVHVDTMINSSLTITSSDRRYSKQVAQLQNSAGTDCITEIFASTRAYPSWWSDLGESRILRRRQSMGETVLERNICFIDTPGFDPVAPRRQSIDAIIEHVEASLRRSFSFASLSDGEILSVLSGSGGVQVDLILYVFTKVPTAYDLDLIRRLSEMSLVVPVVSKADLLSEEDLLRLNSTVSDEMRNADISVTNLECLTLGSSISWPPPSRSVWAVSSASGNDDDNMDASLLMSPEYSQPLAPSDLSALVSHIFDPEKAAWLRHTAVKKGLRWRQANSEVPSTIQDFAAPVKSPHNTASPSIPATGAASPTSSVLSSPSASQVLVSRPGPPQRTTTAFQHPLHLPAIMSPSPFTAARFADHAQREQQLAQARLARWAADLQKSMQNERERFETLQREERRGWLLERWGEVQHDSDGTNISGSETTNSNVPGDTPTTERPRRFKNAATIRMLDPLDPLGILEWDERLRRSGLVVFQVLGGCGVLGAVALWIARHWGFADGFVQYSLWPHAWSAGSGD